MPAASRLVRHALPQRRARLRQRQQRVPQQPKANEQRQRLHAAQAVPRGRRYHGRVAAVRGGTSNAEAACGSQRAEDRGAARFQRIFDDAERAAAPVACASLAHRQPRHELSVRHQLAVAKPAGLPSDQRVDGADTGVDTDRLDGNAADAAHPERSADRHHELFAGHAANSRNIADHTRAGARSVDIHTVHRALHQHIAGTASRHLQRLPANHLLPYHDAQHSSALIMHHRRDQSRAVL